jgi:hypothetical protein
MTSQSFAQPRDAASIIVMKWSSFTHRLSATSVTGRSPALSRPSTLRRLREAPFCIGKAPASRSRSLPRSARFGLRGGYGGHDGVYVVVLADRLVQLPGIRMTSRRSLSRLSGNGPRLDGSKPIALRPPDQDAQPFGEPAGCSRPRCRRSVPPCLRVRRSRRGACGRQAAATSSVPRAGAASST